MEQNYFVRSLAGCRRAFFRRGIETIRAHAILSIIVILLATASIFSGFTPVVAPQSPANSSASAEAFGSLAGRWHCEGKFTSSAKAISANLVFEPILDGNFMLFRHDDEPPFSYHAWSEWGWDLSTRQFVSTTQDSSGGIRLFASSGWMGQTLTWSGGHLPNSTDERFVFDRMDDRNFRVVYFRKKGDSWLAVDSSSCKRLEMN
jgi:hypothetical protein